MGDGMTGDLMPYLSMYEVEVPGWKAKDAEPPYIPQVGNNCTSRGLGDGVDQLQFMSVADPPADTSEAIEFRRVCIEAVYAFGLYKANMRGDGGCYGSAIAQAANELGLVSYEMVGEPQEETRSRLSSWANNPSAIVTKYREAAAPFKVGEIARVRTWEELCGAIANRAIVTMASMVGFATPRDERGICRARGSWAHQMYIGGIIRSDGVETAVQFQSWGPNNPTGPRPFRLPSFAFRTLKADVERQLSENDCWAIRLFPGFKKAPLPSRWTNTGWAS